MSTLLEQASLIMIPSGYKEDVVYSVIPETGAGDLSFTRASNGTRINSSGLVEVVPWNLVGYSEDFSVGWNIQGASITSNSIVAPNGTTTADSLIASNGVNVASGVYVPETTIGVKTISCYVKKGSKRWASLIAYNGNSNCWYDLDNGVVGTRGVNFSASSITSVGNGWFRIDAVMTAAIGADINIGIYATDNDNSLICTGDGTTVSSYIWGAQLNIGATAKPYFPTTDRLNVPRLTYQNGGGGCPSLLLEKQSTNLQIYSEQIDLWNTTSDLSVTANNTTSPDGTQNADKLNENSSNGYHIVGDTNVTLLPSTLYTMSFFAKASERTFARILAPAGNFATESAYFNLTNGACSASAGTVSTQSMGNGWYRCIYSLTTLSSVSGGIGMWIGPAKNMTDAYNTYTGISGYGIYAYGAQIEQSSYPTSYINTTSASATRVQDLCSKTGISSLIGQSEGVLFVDLVLLAYDSIEKWIAFLGGGVAYVGLFTTTGGQFFAEVANSTAQFSSVTYGFSVGQRYKLALAYKTNDFAFYVNGTQVATGNSGTVPATSQLSLQYNNINANLTSRTYNQLCLFPTRLSNSELASLTTL